MISDNILIKKPFVRLLFLGNPITDRRVKNFIAFFLELGFEVEFIFAVPGEWEIGFELKGVHIKQILLEYSSGPRMFRQYSRLLRKELIGRRHCDILFACELYSLSAGADAKVNHRTKQLFYDARELYTELPSVAGHTLKKWFWKRQETIGLEQTDLVIVTAPDDADAIKAVHRFLPPSILVRNLPRREEYQPSNYLREYFHIPAEKKILVYVGGLQADRSLEKIIIQMKPLGDSAVFILIGDGVLKEQLVFDSSKAGLAEIVLFHPPVESEKVIQILSSADVGISLIEANSKSYELALPSKIFEYLLAGLPVVSSPLKQVKELFEHLNGIVFAEPANADSVVGACRKAMELSSDSQLRAHLHEEAFREFTFETDAKNLRDYLIQHPIPETGTP